MTSDKKKKGAPGVVFVILAMLAFGLLWVENYVLKGGGAIQGQKGTTSTNAVHPNNPVPNSQELLVDSQQVRTDNGGALALEVFGAQSAAKLMHFIDNASEKIAPISDPLTEQKVWENFMHSAMEKGHLTVQQMEQMRQYIPWIRLNVSDWRLMPGRSDQWYVGMDFALENTANKDIKDVMLVCQSIGNSGSIIGVHSEVLFERLGAGEKKSWIGMLRMGPVSAQTSGWSCRVGTLQFDLPALAKS